MKTERKLIFFSILVSNMCLLTRGCTWSDRTLNVVEKCPVTKEATAKAAKNKRCDGLSFTQNCTKPSQFKYHCLYSYRQKKFVEVCSIETYIHGVCIVYDTRISKIQPVYNVECKDVSAACPERFRSSEGHLYAICPELMNLTFFDTKGTNNKPTNENKFVIYLAVLLPILIIAIVSSIIYYIRRRRRKYRRKCMTHVLDGEEESQKTGPYSIWKTSISDKFSSMINDEALSVLYCYMCSDSGPPDFIKTEWLDLLNKIRKDVYYESNPVTSEKAQQTLDSLKSHDYLWADQTKEYLTDDAKDEIMYNVSSRVSGNINLFHCSSFSTAQKYLRSHGYSRVDGEKCVNCFIDYCDIVLTLRLQVNILTHVTMNDIKICADVSRFLNVPMEIMGGSEIKRREFEDILKKTGVKIQCRKGSQDSKDNVTWLWRYEFYARPDIVRSCIGLHPHWDIYIIDNKAFRKPNRYHFFPPDIRCLLYCVLLVEDYSLDVNDQSHKVLMSELGKRYFTDVHLGDEINLTDIREKVIDKRGNTFKFESEDIRHDVMYAFVTECLVEDSDLEFFLITASRDVISEYCRSWKYERSEGERCLYLPIRPEKMYDLFIHKLQLDIILHCTMSDVGIHGRISELNVPKEILSWDLSARKRFVENSKLARVEMFRARGMIVGCAGAGKTTLLRQLQGKMIDDKNKSTETTVGMEVHEDLFEIKDNSLMGISEENTTILHSGQNGKKLISMTDFAGQVAYYACHQVYLSRRAFYIIVIDMSKGLDEKVREHNVDRHNTHGSLFQEWNSKDYFHFWLQSIKTYCDEGNTQTKEMNEDVRGIFHPVILIASHKDEVSLGSKEESFYGQLEKCLSEKQTLKELISLGRYFEVECPAKPLTNKQEEKLEEVRKCIVDTVKQLPQWGERIPLKWALLELFFQEEKKKGKKVIAREEIKAKKDIDLSDDDNLSDALRFFHEIGQLIYFSEKEMKNVIIINVQWFVDGFKYIITDETHLARKDCISTLNKTGKITGREMEEVWRTEEAGDSYIHHKQDILPYLDKLGLMTSVERKGKDKVANDELYYIPSMNRIDLAKEYENAIERGQKTPILLFHFKSYLPHFFFFRLVVKCLNKWKALDMEMFCKNAAFYKMDDASHYIVIAVSKTSIQLQVFTPDKEMDLQTDCVIEIREAVKSMIHEITQTFHRQSRYEIGYTCKDINITEEDEEFFLTEEEVIALKPETGRRPCPRHVRGKLIHNIDKNKILQFWRKENTTSPPKDKHQTINESELEADPLINQ